jgi:hypothetical protein
MQIIFEELTLIVQEYAVKIRAISATELLAKPHPLKWSKLEVVGHLIDSAENNLRRFICGQYESTPPFITYNQDFWVNANKYSDANPEDVIHLWRLLNERICTVLQTMPAANYAKECSSGNETPAFHSLSWYAEDYLRHLKHHLNQIIPGSFDMVK